ncbi:MAG: AAA family ATPase [Evtepia gabavorous]
MGCVIVITSGKGGTGKTSLTGGLGTALALQGHKVLCIDGDVGLRNLDITLGMTDAALMDFSDVIAGRCPLGRAVAPHPSVSGLYLLTAPLTLPEDFPGEAGFRDLLAQARQAYEYVLVDSPAGLGAGFRLAVCDADRAIVVAVSDPSSCGMPSGWSASCPIWRPSTWWSTGSAPGCCAGRGPPLTTPWTPRACLSWGWCPRMPRWCWPPAADVPWPR